MKRFLGFFNKKKTLINSINTENILKENLIITF
jgi:hypothetical protein